MMIDKASRVMELITHMDLSILFYYLVNKRSLHVHSQGLKIYTLIEKIENKNYPPLPL